MSYRASEQSMIQAQKPQLSVEDEDDPNKDDFDDIDELDWLLLITTSEFKYFTLTPLPFKRRPVSNLSHFIVFKCYSLYRLFTCSQNLSNDRFNLVFSQLVTADI